MVKNSQEQIKNISVKGNYFTEIMQTACYENLTKMEAFSKRPYSDE